MKQLERAPSGVSKMPSVAGALALSFWIFRRGLPAVNSFRGVKSGAGLVNYKCNKYPTKYFVKGLASECRGAHELGTSL